MVKYSTLLVIYWCSSFAQADRIILKTGKSLYGTIQKENLQEIRYLDSFGRPRKLSNEKVDSLVYDFNRVAGKVHVAYRTGQPTDQSGFVKVKHSEELDLEVVYQTDSISELDLFFKNQTQIRIMPNSKFQILKAPSGVNAIVELALLSGDILVVGHGDKTLAKIKTSAGIAVGRGKFLMANHVVSKDATLVLLSLHGLTGVQEKLESPGELAVEPMQALSYRHCEGVFRPEIPDSTVVLEMHRHGQNMLRYRFETVKNPPVGYLPRALTGLGFLVFFYGSSLGILNYVNQL